MSQQQAKFKRYLIHQDNELLKDILSDIKYFNPLLTALKSAYDALELENKDFNTEVFKSIKASGVAGIVEDYKNALYAGLDSTGVKNNKLREYVLQGSDVPIAAIHKAYSELKNLHFTPPASTYGLKQDRTTTLTLDLIDFIDGQFSVSDVAKESILEQHCRIYIEDEQQDAIYKNLNTLKNGLIEYEKWIGELGLPRSMFGGHYTDSIDQFLSFDRDTKEMQIIPSSIKWAQGLKAYQAMMTKKYTTFRG